MQLAAASGSRKKMFPDALTFLASGQAGMVTSFLVALLAILVSLLVFVFARKKSIKGKIPYINGVPFIGCVEEVFRNPIGFILGNRKKYGDKFYCNIVSTDWLFVLDPVDVKYVLSQPNKILDFTGAYFKLFGFLFPKTPLKGLSPDIHVKMDAFKTTITPHIAHSVRPPVMKAWVPTVEKVFIDILADLPPGKNQRLDLFEYSRKAISGVTTMLMIGEEAFADDKWLHKWTDIFFQCNIEDSMGDPFSAISAMIEVGILGERRIYKDMRKMLLPLVDAEIENCINETPLSDNPPTMVSLIRYWYEKDCNRDPKTLRLYRVRFANDLFNFSTAAFGNSFAAAGWVLYHVLKDTNGLGTQIRKEIEENPEDWTNPTSLPKILQNCILEVTRLYTPGHVPRLVNRTLKLPSDGTVVEPGTVIAVNSFVNMRNDYENSLDFDPSRFDRKEGKKYIFHGFGMGSHPCVGKNLAMLEIGMFVMSCLKFGFRLADRDEVRDSEFMDPIISIQDHPNLSRGQAAFIWRPTNAIYVEYDKE